MVCLCILFILSSTPIFRGQSRAATITAYIIREPFGPVFYEIWVSSALHAPSDLDDYGTTTSQQTRKSAISVQSLELSAIYA